MAGEFRLRHLCLIAIAVCIGAVYAAPSATAAAPRPEPGSPGQSGPANGKAGESHGKAGESPSAWAGARGKGQLSDTNVCMFRSLTPVPGSRGRHLALGHETTPAVVPETRGSHLALGHEATPTGVALGQETTAAGVALGHENPPPVVPGSRGRDRAPGHEGPASKRHLRLPDTPAPKRLNPHAPENTAHPHGARKTTRPDKPLLPGPRAALPFRNVAPPSSHHQRNRVEQHQPNRVEQHQPNRVGHHPQHHATEKDTAKPNANPTLPRSFGAPALRQFTRPGSPAMVLSLIVVVCLVGTAAVVSMARRRPTKPTKPTS